MSIIEEREWKLGGGRICRCGTRKHPAMVMCDACFRNPERYHGIGLGCATSKPDTDGIDRHRYGVNVQEDGSDVQTRSIRQPAYRQARDHKEQQ